jgi:hypothetical protein
MHVQNPVTSRDSPEVGYWELRANNLATAATSRPATSSSRRQRAVRRADTHSPSFHKQIFDISEYGATADGITKNTAAIARVVAAAKQPSHTHSRRTEFYFDSTMDSPRKYLVHDVDFHRAVAQASKNPILGSLVAMVSAALFRQRSRTVAHARDLAISVTMHRRITKAIAQHDANAARDAMNQHLLRAQRSRKLERPRAKPRRP